MLFVIDNYLFEESCRIRNKHPYDIQQIFPAQPNKTDQPSRGTLEILILNSILPLFLIVQNVIPAALSLPPLNILVPVLRLYVIVKYIGLRGLRPQVGAALACKSQTPLWPSARGGL